MCGIPCNGRLSANLDSDELMGPCAGLILSLNYAKCTLKSFAPVLAAKITCNERELASYDLTDMSEYCWLRAGQKAPHDNLTLLLPFNCEGVFGRDISKTCLLNVVRAGGAELILTTDKRMDGVPMSFFVTALCFNIKRMNGGMFGLKYLLP
jgi:hypothetical protein